MEKTCLCLSCGWFRYDHGTRLSPPDESCDNPNMPDRCAACGGFGEGEPDCPGCSQFKARDPDEGIDLDAVEVANGEAAFGADESDTDGED